MPSTEIAEIRLAHPDLVLTSTIEQLPDAAIDLEYQCITEPDTIDLFVRIAGAEQEAVSAALAADTTITESECIIDRDTVWVYRLRLASRERLVLPEAARLGLRLLRASGRDGGWIVTLEFPRRETLHQFRSHCTADGVTFQVRRLYRSPGTEENYGFGLTEAQHDTLATAHRLGYFEDPRQVSLEDVAEELSISSSAASGRLRRGLNTLIGATVARP